ncbi:MAG: type IIA DNA topoisomerase subunit B, partial [Deltaproteobacteria bacterium]
MEAMIAAYVDEFIMGHGKQIDITFEKDLVTVRDYGRGIPLGKVVECVSQINTGGKYNDDVFQFSVGLNGVGTKAVNALSAVFEVASFRDGKVKRAAFAQGKLKKEQLSKDSKAAPGTLVHFVPDPEIFKKVAWNMAFVEHRLRFYAYLNSGLTLALNGTPYLSKAGLRDLLTEEIGDEPVLYDIFHCKLERLEFAFTHTHAYGESYFSFVNGQYTNDGGTHQSAFREGILKGVTEFSGRSFAGEDVRDGIVGAVAVKVQDPVFESQTKNKLGSTDVRSWLVQAVREQVVLWLHQNDAAAQALLDKVRA